jgi:hypothetical protein
MENIEKMAKRISKPTIETGLERAARLWMNDRGRDYDNGWVGAYRDLEYGGCSSGIVSHLIYYSDTTRFYKRHLEEISRLLQDALNNSGSASPADLFGDKWDREDPLALESCNQNLLCWFGFEESARIVADNNGYNE